MLNCLRIIFLSVLLIVPAASFAWNSIGHRLVAQIAIDNLNPIAKRRALQINQALFPVYGKISIVTAASWADYIKSHQVTAFNSWHYIDIPYRLGRVALPMVAPQNVVWAIGQSEKTLQSRASNSFEKGMFLRFLLHFVGDVHQPLHAITRISREYPRGDRGGNLFPIKAGKYKNLHSYWDAGLGVWRSRKKLSNRYISRLAKKYEKLYPKNYFGKKIDDLNPQHWAQQSYKLAVEHAYKITPSSAPSHSYIKRNQQIVISQISLAGYRLAKILNIILGNKYG